MGAGKDGLERELRRSLAGSRAARSRLLEEIDAHLDETIARSGEEEALRLFGDARDVATGWNPLQRRRRRRKTLVCASIASVVALGVTQYAAGGRTRPHDSSSNSSPTSGSLPIRSRTSPGISPEKEMSPNRSDGSCEIHASPSGSGGSWARSSSRVVFESARLHGSRRTVTPRSSARQKAASRAVP